MEPYTPYDQPTIPSASSSNPYDNLLNDDVDEQELDRMLGNDTSDERDYYAILNVDRNASEEDVRNSYKRLAMMFHPDKHQNVEDKLAAEQRFQVIQRAYDVLTTPGKKAAYDLYGEKGLQQVGQRLKTREEIREEYDRFVRERAVLEAEALVKSRGEILMSFDATTLLAPAKTVAKRNNLSNILGVPQMQSKQELPLWKRIQLPNISHSLVRHSWHTQVSPYTSLFISGFATARNGLGSGGALAHIRHIFAADLWTEASVNVGQMGQASWKISKNFSNNVFSNIQFTASSLEKPPIINAVLGRQLTKTTSGYMSFGSGDYHVGSWGQGFDQNHPLMNVGLIRNVKNHSWHLDLAGGLDVSHVQASYNYIIPKRGLDGNGLASGVRLRSTATVSTQEGLAGSLTVDRRIATHSRLGMTVEASYMGGISLRIRWNRLGQRLSLPIVINHVSDAKSIIAACLIPLLGSLMIDKLFITPRQKARVNEKLTRIKEMNADQFESRKKEAEDAQRLMKDQVQRKRDQERSKGGLIIEEAKYGKLDGEMIDVTIPVQALVNSGQLHIPGGQSKSGLIGFHDPSYGETKHLIVKYRFHGILHQATVSDEEPLACPLRGHQISEAIVEGVVIGQRQEDGIAAPNPAVSFSSTG